MAILTGGLAKGYLCAQVAFAKKKKNDSSNTFVQFDIGNHFLKNEEDIMNYIHMGFLKGLSNKRQ